MVARPTRQTNFETSASPLAWSSFVNHHNIIALLLLCFFYLHASTTIMAAFVPGFPAAPGSQPQLSQFGWEHVRVLDPRFEGRTMTLELMTKDIRIPDPDHPPTPSGVMPFKTRKLVLSPLVSTNDPNAIYEIVDFQIADPRFVISTVQVCFTLQESIQFRQALHSAATAHAIANSGEAIYRLKCYVPGCTVTTSKMEKLELHFGTDHPGIPFEVQQVKIYHFGGPNDRKFSYSPQFCTF
jgi:hypothetical protein